ncbi:hypothetical protein T08_2404 [Trichinella sp. T8]|nr:hypothetical protein T08_2404 [Trichinella sp. T8]
MSSCNSIQSTLCKIFFSLLSNQLVDLYHFDQPKMVRSIVRLYNNNDDDDDGKKIYLLNKD